MAMVAAWYMDVLPLLPSFLLFLAVPTFLTLRYVQAPYAKYSTSSLHALWGPPIPAKWAWVIQECPSLLVTLATFHLTALPAQRRSSGNLLLLSLFLLHYIVRVLVFPFLMRGSKPTPLVVMLLSFAFCVLNGAQQGYALGRTVPAFSAASLSLVQLLGIGLFFLGFFLNQQSDHILRSLRAPGETAHRIPRGGLFEWVTAANYCGEFVEWTGWALACQTTAALSFAVYTFANLGPRAVSYHRWYLDKFEDYPKDRKAMIPLIY